MLEMTRTRRINYTSSANISMIVRSNSLPSLIAAIREAENRGVPVDQAALLSQYPEHAEPLCDFFKSADVKNTATPASAASPAEDVTLSPAADVSQGYSTQGHTRGIDNQVSPAFTDNIRYFGDYELLQEIARGGMGVVYTLLESMES